MPKVKILKKHGKWQSVGKVVEMDDIEASHATAFDYGERVDVKKPPRREVAAVEAPEAPEAQRPKKRVYRQRKKS